MEEVKTVGQLYFMVVKKYSLPVRNHNNLKAKVTKLETEVGRSHAQHYLRALLARDLENEPGDFRPVLQESEDIYNKRLKVEQFFRANKPKVTGRVDEQIAEAEANRKTQWSD